MILKLKKSLFVTPYKMINHEAFINGKWVKSTKNKTFPVINPATQNIITNVPDLECDQIESALKAASDSFKLWKDYTGKERGDLLKKWENLMQNNKYELAKLLSSENGKPLKEAEGEIAYSASFLDWFSGEARRIYGDVISGTSNKRKMVVHKEPVGVCSFITPWNFPSAMITRKVGAALAAGCTCVVKPSEETPLSALALARLSLEAGIPAGVFNVVTCSRESTPDVGKLMCQHPLVSKISFTGSTSIGKILLGHAAQAIKKTSMELGGNAPFIIFPTADVEKALDGLMASKFRCSGQTCVCANRILVHADLHDLFAEKLMERVRSLVVGTGNGPHVTIGPLITPSAVDKVEALVSDAIQKGAKLKFGGKRLETTFFEPTILIDVADGMRIWSEEIFGPVASIIKFQSEEEAIAIANSTPYGLASYFYSRDVDQIWRVQAALQFGMVGVNEGIISAAEAPFGGIKQSGFGTEGSKYGIDEFLNKKYVCYGI